MEHEYWIGQLCGERLRLPEKQELEKNKNRRLGLDGCAWLCMFGRMSFSGTK